MFCTFSFGCIFNVLDCFQFEWWGQRNGSYMVKKTPSHTDSAPYILKCEAYMVIIIYGIYMGGGKILEMAVLWVKTGSTVPIPDNQFI